MGNGVAKDLICMTHGHELRRGMLEGIGVKGNKGENWDNCSSIINKIYFLRSYIGSGS